MSLPPTERVIEIMQEAPLENFYRILDECEESHKKVFENVIKWKLGLRDHPFTIKEN